MAMRIGGLASGMDIDTMVSDLMKAERMPLDKIMQKKQVTEWQRDSYREMNSLLLAFRNKTFDMKLSDTYRARTTTSSNESKVVATAKSSAALSSYSISKVQQLATAATKNNAGAISDAGTKIDASKSLYEIKDSFANNNFNWQTGSVESETIAVSEAGNTFQLKSLNRDENVSLKNIAADTSVIINGNSYEIVEVGTLPADTSALTENQVYVTANGDLQFKNAIAKGSPIKVEYAATSKVEKFTASAEKESIQLSKKPVTNLELTLGDATYTYDASSNTFKDSGGNTVNDITMDANTGKVTFANGIANNKEIKANYEQSYFSFDLSTHTSKGNMHQRFLIQGSESLNSTLNKISSSNVGVSAFYDSYTDRVTLTRKETGNFNESGAEIETSSGFLNNILRFGSGEETGGQNAIFTINGLGTQRTSNTFDMNGVTFTLKDTLNKTVNGVEPTNPDPSISINLANNTDKVYENIKEYIDEYNKLIEKINSMVNEERYRDYQPLTDAEREELSDKQQEDWEKMAKSGLLRRDPILTSALTKMRSDFYTPVSGSNIDSNYSQLTSLGISTTSNYLDGGKLEINESELRKAIEENPAAVEALFTSNGSTNGEKGILNRLYDSLTTTMDNIKTKAGNSNTTNSQFTLGRNLDNIAKQIERFEDRLTQVEDRYWRQFTAMEKAIQQSNSQMSYLMQQFA